jgi:hypothetical protein
MRTVLRLLATTAAVTALVIGGASSAFAASDKLPAFSEHWHYEDAWCFDQGDRLDCTVQEVQFIATYTPDLRATGRFHVTDKVTSYDQAGNIIATGTTRTATRSVFVDGFQYATFTTTHNRYEGPEGTCTSTYQVKIVDFEVRFDRFLGPGCK